MIKKNKITIIIANILTLLPILAGIILWDKLPTSLPIRWNVAGKVDSYGSKAVFVFGIPLIMLALLWLCIVITAKTDDAKNQTPKVIALMLYIVPALSCFVNGITYATVLLGNKLPVNFINLLIGAMFMVLGNYLPKCKQKKTIGIRIKWTLESEENWQATHRVAGIVWFFTGIAVLLSALLPQIAATAVMIAAILVAVLVPTVYSYVFYKKTK